jgi:hypothetical protein
MYNPKYRRLQLDTLASSTAACLIESFSKEEVLYFINRLQGSIDLDNPKSFSPEDQKTLLGLPVVTILRSDFG